MEYFRYALSFVFVIGLILLFALVGKILFSRNQNSLKRTFGNRFFSNNKPSNDFKIYKLLNLSNKASFFEITWYNNIYLVYENLGKIEVIAKLDKSEVSVESQNHLDTSSRQKQKNKTTKNKDNKDAASKEDGSKNKSFLKVLLKNTKNT